MPVDFSIVMKGAARVRLIDQRVLDECRKMHPDWPHDEIRELALRRIEADSGWQSNVITDLGRRSTAGGTAFGSSLRIFIHQGTTPANVRVNTLPHVYASQSPDQIRAPDTTILDAATLVQTRTVQYPAPAVARVINIVGLTYATATETTATGNQVPSIAAFTLLSSAVNQSTVQSADVQYRVTFSLDGV